MDFDETFHVGAQHHRLTAGTVGFRWEEGNVGPLVQTRIKTSA